jgi:hypothetical protein
MKVSIISAVLATAGVSNAFWRMPCRSRTGLARMDPLVDFGSISDHAHAIHGGSGMFFAFLAPIYKSSASVCSNTCWVLFCDLGSMGYYFLSLVVLILSTQAFPPPLTQLHSSVVTARLAKSLRIRALIGRPPYISRAPLRESSHWWTKSEACLRKFHSVYLRSASLLFCHVSNQDGFL